MAKQIIVIVEDDEDILYSLKLMLEHAGYEVQGFSSGRPFLNDNLPQTDLLILDKRMPDLDGLDLCKELRKKYSATVLPIIILSASPKFGAEAIGAGANDFLSKPFDMDQLLRVVRKNLKPHI
jgi:DNA-binding response OmpR family regulator